MEHFLGNSCSFYLCIPCMSICNFGYFLLVIAYLFTFNNDLFYDKWMQTDRSKAVFRIWFSVFPCFDVSFCAVFTFCVSEWYLVYYNLYRGRNKQTIKMKVANWDMFERFFDELVDIANYCLRISMSFLFWKKSEHLKLHLPKIMSSGGQLQNYHRYMYFNSRKIQRHWAYIHHILYLFISSDFHGRFTKLGYGYIKATICSDYIGSAGRKKE